MNAKKGWTLLKRDFYVVRWWLLLLVVVLVGDMAVRQIERTQATSEFWWSLLDQLDQWTVRLALGCWLGLVVVLFQQDRMDGRPAFWQARPSSIWRLLGSKVVTLALLFAGLWLLLSAVEGFWSFIWVGVPVALTGLAAAVSVLLPGWRRLAMGLIKVCELMWFGVVMAP